MKKIIACLTVLMMLNLAVYAAHGGGHSNGSHSGSHSGGHHSSGHHSGGHHSSGHHGSGHHSSSAHSHSSSGSAVYLVRKDYKTKEEKFANCNKHYMVVETYTSYYSDGSRRIYTNCTIYNSDGTILEADCQSVNHIMYEKQHYFIIRKNSYCSLINSEGKAITERSYTRMNEIAPNRLLVRADKRYGIIDLKENQIVNLKYQDFKKCGNNIYITKLNGYYGLMNTDGKILVKNDCERIKPLYDTILLKRYGKFGLTDRNGNIIKQTENDRIKKLGEYIVVKKGDEAQLLNSDGSIVSTDLYKKYKLVRNTLFGKTANEDWTEIPTEK